MSETENQAPRTLLAAPLVSAYAGHMNSAAFRQWLETYTASDAREADFQRDMLDLLGARNPFARDQYVPGHFTASGFVLSPDRDSVLLIFHKKLGIWVQPGGHIDSSDSDVLSAARREVSEEVGIHELSEVPGIFDIDIHEIPARKTEPAHRHFDVRFLFQATSREFQASPEVADARWVKLSEINSVTADESVLRAIRKLGA